MLLYHVSVILQHDGLFTPCVPDCVFDGDDEEDETLPEFVLAIQ